MNSHEEVTIARAKALILRVLEKGSQSTWQLHRATIDNFDRDTAAAPSQARILQLLFRWSARDVYAVQLLAFQAI